MTKKQQKEKILGEFVNNWWGEWFPGTDEKHDCETVKQFIASLIDALILDEKELIKVTCDEENISYNEGRGSNYVGVALTLQQSKLEALGKGE